MLTVLASANAQNTSTTYSYNSGPMTLFSGSSTCAPTTTLSGTVTVQTNALINGAGYAPVTDLTLTAGVGQGNTVFSPNSNPYGGQTLEGASTTYILNGQLINASIDLEYNFAGQNIREFSIGFETPQYIAITPPHAPISGTTYDVILTNPLPFSVATAVPQRAHGVVVRLRKISAVRRHHHRQVLAACQARRRIRQS
jgi:hypothetical protein